MTRLRLGPITEDKPVKLTVELPGALHRALGAYARAHASENGLVEPLAVFRRGKRTPSREWNGNRGDPRRPRVYPDQPSRRR